PQLAVQSEDPRLLFTGRLGRRRQRWTDSVVALHALGLLSPPRKLVAVVHARVTGHGEQACQCMGQMSWIPQASGDASDVVVADEGDRCESAVLDEAAVAFHGPRQFEEVGVVQRTPDRLVQLVLGYRVEAALADEAAVVAVDHLPEDERVRMRGPDAI